MALIEFGGHLASSLRHGSEDHVVEHHLRARELLPRVANAPPRNLAGPGDEVGARPEPVEFFADDEARLLQEVLRVVPVGHESVDVGEDLALVAGHQRHESFPTVGFVEVRGGHGKY